MVQYAQVDKNRMSRVMGSARIVHQSGDKEAEEGRILIASILYISLVTLLTFVVVNL